MFSWTQENTAKLIEMWRKNIPAAEIAEALGTTYDSVHSKRRRLKLKAHGVRTQKEPTESKRHHREHRGCAWPIGHPGDKDFRFCDAQPVTGRPYCDSHMEVAYLRRTRPLVLKVSA